MDKWLRIQPCHCCGLGHSCGAGLIPSQEVLYAMVQPKKKEFFLEQIDFYISLSNWEVRDTGAASEVDSPHRSGSCHDTGSPGCTLESQGFKK